MPPAPPTLGRLATAALIKPNQVVADDLDLIADRRGERPPPVRIVLGQAILDAADRVGVDQPLVALDQPAGRHGAVAGIIGAVAAEAVGGGIQG